MRIKKYAAFVLMLILTVSIGDVQVKAASTNEAEAMIQYMEIMNGDGTGDLNLDQEVTRAEFTKMLVSASSLNNLVSGNSFVSVFADVSASHWAAGYIKAATDQGWINGYSDGTFRPNEGVKLEEAAAMVLRILGYDESNLVGTYPMAQLYKYASLDLDDSVTAGQGETLTREDCMYLFINMMEAETSEGTVYGETLGYTMDDEGTLDYATLVEDEMSGPYVVTSADWYTELPFAVSLATIYRNGEEVLRNSVNTNDIYYYNELTKEVWTYNEKAYGTITDIEPNRSAPTAITVGGNSYTLGTTAAKSSVMLGGTYSIGDSVGLLLGSDDEVVAIVPLSEINDISYGVVVSTAVSTFKNADGMSEIVKSAVIVGTDGEVDTYYYDGDLTLGAGAVVEIVISGGNIAIDTATLNSVVGEFDAEAMTIGGTSMAENIRIIDVNSEGDYIVVYPDQLDGINFKNHQVYLAAYDENREIDELILNDVTGDIYTYGLVYETEKNYVKDTDGLTSVYSSKSYTFMIEGNAGSTTLDADDADATTGGVRFVYDEDGILEDLVDLSRVTVESMTQTAVKSGNKEYTISSDVQVYYLEEDEAYLIDISADINTEDYAIAAYYDTGFQAGGVVRVMTVREK